MRDIKFNVSTHDLDYYGIYRRNGNSYNLPGELAHNPPLNPMAKSTHDNTCTVAKFLKRKLKYSRQFISTVKCANDYEDVRKDQSEWTQSLWIPSKQQAVYGQRFINDQLKSYGENLDIVTHEIFHGVTQSLAGGDLHLNDTTGSQFGVNPSRGLAGSLETGALNESYSDIFSVIHKNFERENIDSWVWEFGRPYGENGTEIRSLQHPSISHMTNYKRLEIDREPSLLNDYGWIHLNNGIHNKAAYNLITSKNSEEEFILTPIMIAKLFFNSLRRISRNATFLNSKNSLLNNIEIVFSADSEEYIDLYDAIESAFDLVGIT